MSNNQGRRLGRTEDRLQAERQSKEITTMGIEDTAADVPIEGRIKNGHHRHKPDQRRKRIKQKRQKRTIKRAAAAK